MNTLFTVARIVLKSFWRAVFLRSALAALFLFAPSLRAADGSLAFTAASQQRVDVPNFQGLGLSSEVTVEFWAKTTATVSQSAFVLDPDATANRFNAHLNYFNGNTYWDFGDITAGGRVLVANPANTLGNWTHYALVGSATGSFMKIYVNGAQIATVPTSPDSKPPLPPPSPPHR